MNRESEWKSESITDFRGSPLPEAGALAGYSALIDHFELQVPLPPYLAAIGMRRSPAQAENWLFLPNRVAAPTDLVSHLDFALKHEGVNLAVLSALFRVVPKQALEPWIRSEPSGANTRRAWFIYEWLTGDTLDVQPTTRLRAVPIIDRTKQFGLDGGDRSARHSVIDNLPGTREFCPIVRRTPKLDAFEAQEFDRR